MPRPALLLKKSILWLHRWLGVALSVLFTMWFASGIVMMYWDFPSVSEQDRLDRSPLVDTASIRFSPGQALQALGTDDPPEHLTLVMFDGHPAYRFTWGRKNRLVYADSGKPQGEPVPELLARAAAQWAGEPAGVASVQTLREPDQWTVQGEFRSVRPLWKFTWPDGQQAYVSAITGEVVQYTTRASRFWSWLGPIPHWMYFLPLRQHGRQWSGVVEWTSAIGTLAASLGMILGVWMFAPAKRVPYRGQKRWHTIFGLIFGLSAVTWAFSGLLSMEPFPSLAGGDEPEAASAIEHSLRGDLNLTSFPTVPPFDAPAKEFEFLNFDGQAIYLAHLGRGETRVVPLKGQPQASFDIDRINGIVKAAAPDIEELRVLSQYDRYYLDRRQARPLPVILARTRDSRIYIDPKTARIAGGYTAGDWTSRWLYHGLHSLNFPWLYRYRPLWDVVVISLLSGGCALCVTSLILAWRVLRRAAATR
jgi:hypothetical protein